MNHLSGLCALRIDIEENRKESILQHNDTCQIPLLISQVAYYSMSIYLNIFAIFSFPLPIIPGLEFKT